MWPIASPRTPDRYALAPSVTLLSAAPRSCPGITGLQAFARHRAWVAAPHASVEVDHGRDLVLVSCYPGLADTDLDVSAGLSAGFHGDPGDQLLTTLVLSGARRWHRPGDAEAGTARHLIGPVIGAVVRALTGPGGERAVELTRGDGEAPAARWRRFLARS